MKAAEARGLLAKNGVATIIDAKISKLEYGDKCIVHIADGTTSGYVTSARDSTKAKEFTVQAAYRYIRRELEWLGNVTIKNKGPV